jgi:hypothetical protein
MNDNLDNFDSSIDGSLNDESIVEPAIVIPNSPESFNEFSSTSKVYRSQEQHEFSMKSLKHAENSGDFFRKSFEEFRSPKDMYNDSDDNSAVLNTFMPNCCSISKFLSQEGFPSVLLINADVDQDTGSVSTVVIESWAETVLSALMELKERIDNHRQTMSRVSSSNLRNEAGQENLLQKMEELQAKLRANELREKAALQKIALLTEAQEKKSKTGGSDLAEAKQSLKRMAEQVVEYERQGRVKDSEIDRLKKKLAHVVEKEREVNARNRQILTQVKSGDVSFLQEFPGSSGAGGGGGSSTNNMSFTSAASGGAGSSSPIAALGAAQAKALLGGAGGAGRSGSAASARGGGGGGAGFGSSSSTSRMAQPSAGRTPTKGNSSSHNLNNSTFSPLASNTAAASAASFTAVIDALESQRRELVLRNKELELQVRDLLQVLKQKTNEENSRGSRSGRGARGEGREYDDNRSDNSSSLGDGTGFANSTAKSMYQRIMQQEEEIDGMKRQLEVSDAMHTEREEAMSILRERFVCYLMSLCCYYFPCWTILKN